MYYNIIFGICEGCSDQWKYTKDLYNGPNSLSDAYTDLYFYHPEWDGMLDNNNVDCCDNDEFLFESDMREFHPYTELQEWKIYGKTRDIPADELIELSWESDSFEMIGSIYDFYIFNSAKTDCLHSNTFFTNTYLFLKKRRH